MQNISLLSKRISINPKILHGKPRIKGSRIAVSMVLELLSAGYSIDEICSEQFYPSLKRADVLACIAFANQFLADEDIHFAEELKHTAKA